MIARTPQPDSAWQRHCPEVCPREWIENGKLPEGFVRPATSLEADLIHGRISEAAYTAKNRGTPMPPSALLAKPRKRKRNPVVTKLAGWNRFLDGLVHSEPRLTPLAVAIWNWLYRCEKNGSALTSERKLAERFGVGRTAIRAKLRELIAAGFLEVIRKGKHNRDATVYRVKTGEPRGAKIDPVQGLESPHQHSSTK